LAAVKVCQWVKVTDYEWPAQTPNRRLRSCFWFVCWIRKKKN